MEEHARNAQKERCGAMGKEIVLDAAVELVEQHVKRAHRRMESARNVQLDME